MGCLFLLGGYVVEGADKGLLKVLIVDGFGNHDWRKTTAKLESIMEKAGGVDVDVSTVPEHDRERKSEAWKNWSPNFSAYDVVIQTCNDINNGKSWPSSAQRVLERYVGDGGGMLIFHSANNAFPGWSEYNRMIGLGWRKKDFGKAILIDEGKLVEIPKGEGLGTGHGKRLDALVYRLGNHPIHRGYPRAWRAADLEIYWYARGPVEKLTVLSYAREPRHGLNFPIEWVVEYGKGRVHNSTFGHYWHNQEEPPGMRCVGFQTTFLRALYWLAKREITISLPGNFPDKDSISLE